MSLAVALENPLLRPVPELGPGFWIGALLVMALIALAVRLWGRRGAQAAALIGFAATVVAAAWMVS